MSKAEKPELSQTADVNSQRQGTITIESPYSVFKYYRQGTTETETEDKVITDLLGSSDPTVSSDYYVYVAPQKIEGEADYNFVTASDKASIKVENIVIPVYSVTVYIDGEALATSQKYYENKLATVVAAEVEGKFFSHWATDAEGKNIVSYKETYKFYVTHTDITLYAVYADVEAEGAVTAVILQHNSSYAFTEDSRNYVGFDFTREISSDYDLISHGVLYGTSASVFGAEDANLDNLLRFADNKGNSLNDKVKQSVIANNAANGTDYLEIAIGNNADGIVYARGYVIVRNKTTKQIEIVYTQVVYGSFNSLSK